jgi:hypothetical protein
MKEIIKRFALETPLFFKRMMAAGASIAAAGIALVAIPNLPHAIVSVGQFMITAGAVIAAISKLTVKNPDDLKK